MHAASPSKAPPSYKSTVAEWTPRENHALALPRWLKAACSPKFTVRKVLLLLSLLALYWSGLLNTIISRFHPAPRPCVTREFGHLKPDVTSNNLLPFPPPEISDYRVPDSIDAFASYKYRDDEECQISSLDLHSPFGPLCPDRQSFLTAYSSGGRIGKNAPFMPRGCDMRWFTSEEICEILSRFEKVVIVGDSMMRHVVGAINVLLRRDLGYGAVTDWNFRQEERDECFCNQQFHVKGCSLQGIFKTLDVEEHDPDSLSCGLGKINLIIEMMLRYPLDPTEVSRYRALLSTTKPEKPYAFIFGHGLWNDLDLLATVNWLTEIIQHTEGAAPYLGDRETLFPRLMITPNAAGPLKPDQWLVSQGDKALQIFEESVRDECAERWPSSSPLDTNLRRGRKIGVEHMGTWNMSIQAEKYDGVHLDLRGNLVKAMGVMNWLAGIEVEEW